MAWVGKNPNKIKTSSRPVPPTPQGGNDSDTESLIFPQAPHDPAPKAPKPTKIGKFLNFCKKMKIPYPENSLRERDHLDICETCQELWPLYLFQQQYLLATESKQPLETIIENWTAIREKDRLLLLKTLRKEDQKWMKSRLRIRDATAYHLYFKTRCAEMKNQPFAELTPIIAQDWKVLPEEERKVYQDQANSLREQRKINDESIPEYKLKLLKEAKRTAQKSKPKKPKKPITAYMRYLIQRWENEKEKPGCLKFKDLMKICAKEWADMEPVQKQPYQDLFAKAQSAHLKRKKTLEDKQGKKKVKE